MQVSSTTDPLLSGTEGEGSLETQSNVQIEKKLNTNIGELDVGYLRKLFQRMTDDKSIRIPVDDSRLDTCIFGAVLQYILVSSNSYARFFLVTC
jgi:hypothetical protein